ncbi:MAG: hypothetical protein WCD18_19155, partial [Thermosynechococcaceae cyanobacterium]
GESQPRAKPLQRDPLPVSNRPTHGTYATAIDVATVIRSIMEDLAQRYPDATQPQRVLVAALEIQQMAKRETAFQNQLIDALQFGNFLLDQALQNNAFVSLSFETVKGWLSEISITDYRSSNEDMPSGSLTLEA